MPAAFVNRPFRILEQAGEIFLFLVDILVKIPKILERPGSLVHQVHKLGVLSVPLIVITGGFTGLVLAAQTYGQLNRLNVETLVGPIVGVGMVAELGPVLACLMLASRVGGAMAAELGTMRVTEQIDALRVFGADPVTQLVIPRFLACILIAPLLTLMADIVGILGGYLLAVKVYGIDAYLYIEKTKMYMGNWHVFIGLVKASCFGLLIALFCCWRGLVTQGGAVGVGRAATQANVLSAIGILILNFFLTVALNAIYNRFVL